MRSCYKSLFWQHFLRKSLKRTPLIWKALCAHTTGEVPYSFLFNWTLLQQQYSSVLSNIGRVGNHDFASTQSFFCQVPQTCSVQSLQGAQGRSFLAQRHNGELWGVCQDLAPRTRWYHGLTGAARKRHKEIQEDQWRVQETSEPPPDPLPQTPPPSNFPHLCSPASLPSSPITALQPSPPSCFKSSDLPGIPSGSSLGSLSIHHTAFCFEPAGSYLRSQIPLWQNLPIFVSSILCAQPDCRVSLEPGRLRVGASFCKALVRVSLPHPRSLGPLAQSHWMWKMKRMTKSF
jgi:hypothetical protein